MRKTIFLFVLLLMGSAGTLSIFAGDSGQITITILFDNYAYTDNTTTGWGFSCLIDGTEKNILFDTGLKGKILLQNMDSLYIGHDRYDLIVISHNHLDHTGGLQSVLSKNPGVPVWFGVSFPAGFSKFIKDNGASPVIVDEPVEICKHVYSTGEIKGMFNEQSLILDTDSGLVVITGCAHPGIVNIIKKAKEILPKDIYMVMGGFHLVEMNDDTVNQIILELRSLGVKKCGATHCTGDRAIELFKNAYGENYVPMGTGMVIKVPGSSVAGEEPRQ